MLLFKQGTNRTTDGCIQSSIEWVGYFFAERTCGSTCPCVYKFAEKCIFVLFYNIHTVNQLKPPKTSEYQIYKFRINMKQTAVTGLGPIKLKGAKV